MSGKIQKKLKDHFPDLSFFGECENMSSYADILEQMLKKEEDKFSNILSTNDDKISFDTFQDRSVLSYFFGIVDHINNVSGTELSRTIIEEFEPKYLKFSNEIAYSKRYYEMLKICFENTNLDEEQKKIISDVIEAYEIRGIHLKEKDQNELKKLNEQLTELRRKFSVNVLKSEGELSYYLENEEYIGEMPQIDRENAQRNAEKDEREGYLFGSSISEYITLMKYCNNSSIRKELYKRRNEVASSGKYDNRAHVFDLLKIRKKKAELLGFKDYTDLSLHFKMANGSKEVLSLIRNISKNAMKKAEKEIKDLKDYFSLDSVEAWDTAYYFRKYKEEALNYNETELKQYFEYENVINGMFEIMKGLYGIELKKTGSSKLGENDIEYYEVWRNQKLISYFMIDPFFTKQKRSGAWANNLQEKDEKHIPFVINVYNIKKATSGPTLLSFSEVETIFHEFGHAMHEMLSVSQYPELSGFHVERDFVELPSQFHEHYCRDEESLALFAKHRETGEQIPKRILETLKTLDHVDSGNMVLNQCVYAGLDMYIHSGLQTHDTSELEESILHYINDVSYFKKEETYKMYCSFSHIFDGGYAAGYYSYLWSEVLELDIRKKFQKEGIFSPDTSKDFYEKILSQGSKKKASDLFENFMNRPMSTDGFFKDKGFIV